jgi:hypothetical protein
MNELIIINQLIKNMWKIRYEQNQTLTGETEDTYALLASKDRD